MCVCVLISIIIVLDDIIKHRRKDTKAKTVQDKRRAQLKSTKKTTQQPSAAQKSVGRGKAAKQALLEKRRGLRQNAKPTKMEVDDQVGKQKKKDDKVKKGGQQQQQKKKNQPNLNKQQMKSFRDTERKASSLMKIAEQAVEKAKEGKNNGSTAAKNRPPTRKAIDAAVAALQLAGYSPPDGMKMVIKLESANSGASGSGGGNVHNRDRKAQAGSVKQTPKKKQQQNKPRQTGSTNQQGRNDGYRQARQGGRSARFRGGNSRPGERYLDR